MEKEIIKKNIDDAVRIFRESLEKTYLKEGDSFYGIGQHTLMNFFSGKITHTRLKDGSLKISGCIPSIAFKEGVVGLPRKRDDWKIFPVVITLFQEDVK